VTAPNRAAVNDELDALKGLLACVIEACGGNGAAVTMRTLNDPDIIREQAAWFRNHAKQQPHERETP
jgi:hypothetical protein